MSIKINHILVRTNDLKSMCLFLIQNLVLTKGFSPSFGFPDLWVYSDDKLLIQIVESVPNDEKASDNLGEQTSEFDTDLVASNNRVFTNADCPELIDFLNQKEIKYYEQTIPSTNEHQFFVDGPDGLKLEISFNIDKLSIVNEYKDLLIRNNYEYVN